ncbi:MAG TPA: hypothetical protein VKN76_03915 [Kiloniellaceae bacterium]|nr:hypothetical protein [Kiloniellaceae bacterium]
MLPLRSDYLVALNDAVGSLEEAGNLYATAAERFAGQGQSAPFAGLSERRREMAAVLKRLMQDQEDVPSTPPSEQLLLQGLVAQLKALWADDEVDAFLADAAAYEEAAKTALVKAADLATDDSVSQRLSAFGAEIESDLGFL